MSKLVRDIELLLRWTFRDELPKGRPVSASAWDNIARYGQLGTRVDVSRYAGDPFGLTPGEPNPDAVTIGQAVRALPARQCIDDIDGARALLPDAPLLTFLGERAVMTTTFNLAALVITHAVQASRPVYDLGPMMPRPVIGTRGQPVLVGKRYGKDRYSEGAFCPLEISEPSVAQVMAARADYAVWRIALEQLVGALVGALAEHEVTGPAAPAAPWVSGEPPKARVLDSLLPPVAITPSAPRPRALCAPSYRLGKAVRPAAEGARPKLGTVNSG